LFATSATFWLLDDSGMQLGDLTGARFESLLSAEIGRVTTRADLEMDRSHPEQIAGKAGYYPCASWLLPLGATKFESESRAVFRAEPEITVAVRPM
jgi:hypothetical protein